MLAWAYTSVAIAAALLAAPVDAQGHHNRRRLGAEHEKRGVNVGWTYGSTKIRGVNIGGWLVLEPWITPSLFEATNNTNIVDEWTFCSLQSTTVAKAALQNHWSTWITADDFRQIAAAGLNHVRIPIGYWAWDVNSLEPYIQGQVAYLDNAISWARQYGLKVMLDLHGAPGSQNGYDNSGHKGTIGWNTAANVARTKAIVNTMAVKYSDPSYWQVVTAFNILNEPAGYSSSDFLSTTRQFYYDSYGTSRWPWAEQGNAAKSGLVIVLHDAFQPTSYWSGFMPEPTWEDVMMDTHSYSVFSDYEVSMTPSQHVSTICNKQSSYASSTLWLVVGEWSLARTDCAKYLNGRNAGARYDGTRTGSSYVGSCSGMSGTGADFSAEYKTWLRSFWDTQTQVYEGSGQGWVFWAWKTEQAAEWSYQAGVAGGWIPSNPSQHVSTLSELCV